MGQALLINGPPKAAVLLAIVRASNHPSHHHQQGTPTHMKQIFVCQIDPPKFWEVSILQPVIAR
ncbi:MAG: hypothetical protein ACJAUG_001011 [Halioglobus sp.]|jgi:hypothetical protein